MNKMEIVIVIVCMFVMYWFGIGVIVGIVVSIFFESCKVFVWGGVYRILIDGICWLVIICSI